MYISKIHIENFKCFKEITIHFEDSINVIIGKNNAGKSTLFEAIRLWNLAFSKYLKERTNNKSVSSFYSTEYFSFTLSDVNFLRISDFESLYNSRHKFTSQISLFFCNNTEEIELPIEFTKTNEGHNLRFSLCKSTNGINNSKRIEASKKILKMLAKPEGSSLREFFFCTYLYPLFLLPTNEPEYGVGYVRDCLHASKAENVIRNILTANTLPLVKSINRYKTNDYINRIQEYLHTIIKGCKRNPDEIPYLSFFQKDKKGEKPYINIIAENENKTKVELAQLGTGTINLINIIATLFYGDYRKYNLSLLLLDEPDSHLHANHQKQLFSFLNTVSKDENKQILIITHNHELINNFKNVIFIDSNSDEKTIRPIEKDNYLTIYEKIAPEYHQKMLEISSLQNEHKDIVAKLEQVNKPVILVEGDSDVAIFKKAFEKLYGKQFFDGKINIISCAGSVSGIKAIISSNLKDNIMGIVDCDGEGIRPFEEFRKDTSFEEKEYVLQKKGKSVFFMKLPVPSFRREVADFFEANTFIEYLFTDETLEKNGVQLETIKGTTFKTIQGHYKSVFNSKNNEFKTQLAEQKTNFHKNLKNLKKEDFSEFDRIFKTISECFNIKIKI